MKIQSVRRSKQSCKKPNNAFNNYCVSASMVMLNLLLSSSAFALGISGIWKTNQGDYLLLTKDKLSASVGVQLSDNPNFNLQTIWIGKLSEKNINLESIDKKLSLNALLNNETLNGVINDQGQKKPFSATLILPWQGSSLDGIWKKDNSEQYLFVFNGSGENGGLAVVSDVDLSKGTPTQRLSLGKTQAHAFSDLQSNNGLRLTLSGEKLLGEYAVNLEPAEEAVITQLQAKSTSSASTSGNTSFSASRVVHSDDSDARINEPKPDDTKKGCDGAFRALQNKVSDIMMENLANNGATPGQILSVSSSPISEIESFDGGKVPIYKITFLADTGFNVGKLLQKQPDQNGYIRCNISGATGTVEDFEGTATSEMATTFCSQLAKSAGQNLKLRSARLAVRGLSGNNMTFNSYVNTKGQIWSKEYLDTQGTFTTPLKAGSTTEYTPEYDKIVAGECKQRAVYSSDPYPAWHSSSPEPIGTPEQLMCLQPGDYDAFSVKDDIVGAIFLDITAASFYFPFEIALNEAYGFYKFSSEEQSQQIIVEAPIHRIPKDWSASAESFVSSTVKCGYDLSAEQWPAILSIEPHLELCKQFPPIIQNQLNTATYKAITTPDENHIRQIDNLAAGLATNTAATLGALKIGGFYPLNSSTIKSKVKFVSALPYPSTISGAPTVQTNTMAYTIEAPYCK